ncbi:MAG: 2,3-bisphosphoglycerate-independent phosphoglycerate mutase [Candidatus Doudnabacteria bacterium]
MSKPIYKKIVLVVMDGFGIASYSHGNAVAIANPQGFNDMVAHYPALTLLASGPVVGLPWGEMGNSEVGHMNMGAGRIVGQDLPRINQAISNHSFFSNNAFNKAADHVKKHDSALHIIGMIGNGGVHSSEEHLFALLGFAAEQNLKKVYIHVVTDGRDTAEKAALASIVKLNEKISQIGVGEVATITGRFYAMDRGGHWDQTVNTYKAMVDGVGEIAKTTMTAVSENYQKGIFDEMIPPTVIMDSLHGEAHPTSTIQSNDAVIFFNFRPDRALQLTQAFVKPEIIPETFRQHLTKLNNLLFVTMTEYGTDLPVEIAFETIDLHQNLTEVLSQKGFKQYHTAETEKFAHVTSFFNGGKVESYPGEERKIIQSPDNNKDYATKPEMSGELLTHELVDKIRHGDYQFYLANFANADMVGHTGNLEASIKAVGFLDDFLQQIKNAVLEVNGLLIITADHGNIEQMLEDSTGEINKEHTTNPIPLIAIAKDLQYPIVKERTLLSLAGVVPSGMVADIAPTILDFFGIEQPPEMNGVSLYSQIHQTLLS